MGQREKSEKTKEFVGRFFLLPTWGCLGYPVFLDHRQLLLGHPAGEDSAEAQRCEMMSQLPLPPYHLLQEDPGEVGGVDMTCSPWNCF